MRKQNLKQVREKTQEPNHTGNTRGRISAVLSKSDKEKTMNFVEEYGSLLRKIRDVAEDRDVEGLPTVHIELDNRENATESEVEEALLRAFRNLPALFEEFGRSLNRMPGNSIRSNIESLEELKIFLKDLHEYFGKLQKELNADSLELISVITDVQNKLSELLIRVIRMIDSNEDFLSRVLSEH